MHMFERAGTGENAREWARTDGARYRSRPFSPVPARSRLLP
jgi:hypothetical protein